MGVIRFLFSFRGRMRRRDWWGATVALTAAYLIVWYGFSRVMWGWSLAGAPEYSQPIIGDPLAPLLLNVAVTVPFVWAQTAIAARRAHDRNETAWVVGTLQVLNVATSYLPVDIFAPNAFADPDPLATAMAVTVALSMAGSLYLLVALGFRDGTQGPNRFGPSPKGIGGDPAEATARVFS